MGLPPYLIDLELVLSHEFMVGVEAFYDILTVANAHTNLTRITDEEEFWAKHILDSLLGAKVLPELQTEELHVADVGCGGGFPGIPLALAFPNLQIVEIDSTGKKIAWIHDFIDALDLSSLAVQGRARELSRSPDHAGRYDVVTARAVSETPKLIKECRLFLKPGGVLLAYKTPEQVEQERAVVMREAEKLGFDAEASTIFELPDYAGQRQFWILRFPQ